MSPVEFKPIQTSPFTSVAAPVKATLGPDQLQVLSTLFFIEDDMVDGLRKLDALIKSGQQISPHKFENALSKISDALKSFDDFDEGVNTVFAGFDQLVKLHITASRARTSSLKLVSHVGIQEVTKVFVA